MFDASKIHKILVVSLTNIGDVVLTFPVIDILKRDFPSAELSVVVGPKAESLVADNPHFKRVYIFDKHQAPLKSLSWVLALRRQRFDLVVDLRNTAIPFMIAPRCRTSCRVGKAEGLHMRDKHLNRLRSVYDFAPPNGAHQALVISETDRRYVEEIIAREVGPGRRYVVVAPGAADAAKRWPEEKFAAVGDQLAEEYGVAVVLAGSREDRDVARSVLKFMHAGAVNLCGQTSLVQLAQLLRSCCLALVNDSAPMHLASYVDVPVVALFGPTDPAKYGPWSRRSFFLRNNESCAACRRPKAPLMHTCLAAVGSEDVLNVINEVVDSSNA